MGLLGCFLVLGKSRHKWQKKSTNKLDLLSWKFYARPLLTIFNHCFSFNKVSSDITNDKRQRDRGYWIAKIVIWRDTCQHVKWLNNLLYITSGNQARHNNLGSKATTLQTFRGWVIFAIVLNLKHISFRIYGHLWASTKLHHVFFSFYILILKQFKWRQITCSLS